MILKARPRPQAGTALTLATALLFGVGTLAIVSIVNGPTREPAMPWT